MSTGLGISRRNRQYWEALGPAAFEIGRDWPPSS